MEAAVTAETSANAQQLKPQNLQTGLNVTYIQLVGESQIHNIQVHGTVCVEVCARGSINI